MTKASLDAVLAHVDSHIGDSLERLQQLLRIKSISTDPAFAGEVRRAADWLAADLASEGFEASARATPGHPIVVGHDLKAEGPHLLFYGHYDVQPVDPLELWNSDPFEPELRREPDGETHIVARGASDDKGQLMTFVEACRAWRAATGSLPVKVTMLFEGEEETGGKSLPGFLAAARDELRADIALVCDTEMWNATTPSITAMLRGLVGEEIEITCARQDLHSGMFGGAARNPNHVLGEIIASLHDADGRIAIPGIYDDVVELPADVAAQWQRLGFDDRAFLGNIGLSIPAGEKDRSVLEQIWSRPTCEVNGMLGGYTGDGFKTVIPAKARAKISFRLVAGQDPQKIRAAFEAHVRARVPPDCSVTFTNHGASPAIAVPTDGPHLRRALQALTDEWEHEAAIIASGGSIPVVGEFKRLLGMDTLLIGFAHTDDRIHSPNEKYNLSSFHKGIRSWVRIIAALAG
ncbi:MAG TPA: dipeptidase [Alphaproteobacteria bacterium]|nr:dipeptidase [Alphaproteobacteria bacterium]